MNSIIQELALQILDGKVLDRDQCVELARLGREHFEDMLYWANRIRQANLGNRIRCCSIVAGRLGGCSQDCAFCAQSVRYDTPIDKTPKLLTDDEIMAAAKTAKDKGVGNFGIVYSGKAVSEAELDRLVGIVKRIKAELGMGVCMGLGILNESQLKRLADAGVVRYNHNLETSERYFADIVSTHVYADRVNTIDAALKAGLGVCGGGIFGIGETMDDRIDMAMELRQLGVDMVPMNFLHPIEGTPLAGVEKMPPMEILHTVALYRFILPKADLKVAGGRVLNLRDMQSWMFRAGATAMMTGNYLTTAGRSTEEDMQMLTDLGLEAV